MKLPENYYWIPGFEQRYALRRSHWLSQGTPLKFHRAVYSFICPGAVGDPVILQTRSTRRGETVSLSHAPGHGKYTYCIDDLIKSTVDKISPPVLTPATKQHESRQNIIAEIRRRMPPNADRTGERETTAQDIVSEIRRTGRVAPQSECSEERSSTQTQWIVGQIAEDGSMTFQNHIELFYSEGDANAKAKRLTSVHKGLSFVVLKTVRKYVNSGIVTVDMA